ncbi:MAG: nucleotidyltransferase family protein [Bacteroidetes bacterium]|nr:nucleotidyltransferase family protein [Bacteroidota bacterium]
MKKDLNKILTILRGVTPFLRKEFNVESIEVFGSYIRKEQNLKSDLDLLVTFSKTPSLLKFVELENFLSDKIGIKVDLVMKNTVKPGLKHSILSHTISV